MKFKWFVFYSFLCFVFYTSAQDILYTTVGTKISVKLMEVNLTDIKYKDFSNLEGPMYVISKSQIVLIQYANGVNEVINENPSPYSPKKDDAANISNAVAQKKAEQPNLYYMNKNLFSINALALANGDATFMYDREFLESRLSVSVLGGYNFNSRMGAFNYYIADSKDAAKKKYDVGFGINFMPRNTKRVQYFIGFLTKYMEYSYDKRIIINNNQVIYEKSTANQVAILVTNGWIYRITPFFNFKLFGGIGGQINSVPLDYTTSSGFKVNYGNNPKVYLGYCFGYRF